MTKFYDIASEIDRLIIKRTISSEDMNELMKYLDKEYYYKYFFVTCNNPAWFNILQANNIFSTIPETITSNDGNAISFPVWWPGLYLAKVADQYPKEVTGILKEINTNNASALNLVLAVVLKLPAKYSKTLLRSIDRWLDVRYQDLLINKYAIDLLGELIDSNEYEASFDLLKILSKPMKNKNEEPTLRYERYYYDEKIVKRFIPLLIKQDCPRVIALFEDLLKQANSIGMGGESGASYWRDAVEKIEWEYDYDVRNSFTNIIRDAISELYRRNEPKTKEILQEYLNDKHTIFKRIAIHSIRINNINDLAEIVIGNKENLYDFNIFHEYYLLVNNKFALLPLDVQRQYIKWILEGFKNRDGSLDKEDHWITRRLFMIKDIIVGNPLLAEFAHLIQDFHLDKKQYERPDQLAYTTGTFVGPTSPLTKEDLSKMSPEEFISYIIKDFKPSGHSFGENTPEGLARILMEVVKDNPAVYAEKAELFLQEGVYPTYISNYLRGFQEAIKGIEGTWKTSALLDWQPILIFCEKIMTRQDDEALKTSDPSDYFKTMKAFDFGRYSWVRGSIADLLGEAVKRGEQVLTPEALGKIKSILFYILENDPNPTCEEEVRPGKGRMDYVTYAINCNRGKALHALMSYALRHARMTNKDDVKGKGPFPPGERLEPDVKALISKIMKKEISPSVHSVFGFYLPQLYYLDQKFIEEMTDNGSLFPTDETKIEIWCADWQGYLFTGNFFNQLYVLLKSHYRKAIESSMVGERLGEHMMLAYWRELDGFDLKDSLIKLFFDKAPLEVRKRAIMYAGTALEHMNDEKQLRDKWPRMRALWEIRLKEAKDDEPSAFVISWLMIAPEPIENIVDLIKASIKTMRRSLGEYKIVEYLIKQVNLSPKISMEILIALINARKADPEIFLYDDKIRGVIDIARRSNACNDLVNEAVNILGEMGGYGFRDLLVK